MPISRRVVAATITIALSASAAFAQNTTPEANPETLVAQLLKKDTLRVSKVPSLTIEAKGPKGLGWLKMGTHRKTITKGTSIDGVGIESDLSEVNFSHPFAPNATVTSVSVKTPFFPEATSGHLYFIDDYLIRMEITIGKGDSGELMLKSFSEQINQAYGGAFTKTRGMTETECSYKNGAKFIYKNGRNAENWFSHYADDIYIETTLSDSAVFTGCPESLIGFRSPERRSSSLVIRLVKIDSSADTSIENKKKVF